MESLINQLPAAWQKFKAYKSHPDYPRIMRKIARQLGIIPVNEQGDRCYNAVIDWLDANHPNWRGDRDDVAA